MFFLTILIILSSSAYSIEIYKQCGGIAYSGSTSCDTTSTACIVKDPSYAQCQTKCPSPDWTCKSNKKKHFKN